MSGEAVGNGEPGRWLMYDVGLMEPGTERFLEERERSGASGESRKDYTKIIGSVRVLAGKPILELSKDEIRALDKQLVSKAKVYRTVLKMFLRDNERIDLDAVLRRQHRPKKRKLALEEILFPEDVVRLIAAARSLRDRGFLATLYATGGRIGEVLNLRREDVRKSNGGYQVWFGRTKSAGQERYSPPITGIWKEHLDRWLTAHKGGPKAFLFMSTSADDKALDTRTIKDFLNRLAKRAGITKKHNPHWFRHSRISMAFVNRESDLGILCTYFWGIPVTPMANLYSHFQGLDTKIEPAKDIEMKPVPALPIPPIVATQAQVAALTAKLEMIERRADEWLRLRARILGLETALDAVLTPEESPDPEERAAGARDHAAEEEKERRHGAA
jgi:integrase